MRGRTSKIPDYSVSFTEPVICAKPGRTVLLKLCIAVLAVVGVPAVGVMIWAEVTGFNLNHLPVLPRLGLAAVAVACAFGIYSCVQERQVQAKLLFFREALVLSYASYPSLWSDAAPGREIQVQYRDVKQCIYSLRRMKVTLDARRYSLTQDGAAVQKTGVISFSTLGASETDFARLTEKHTPLKVLTKN